MNENAVNVHGCTISGSNAPGSNEQSLDEQKLEGQELDMMLPDWQAIVPVQRTLQPALQALLDSKTKPPGSLGRLEALALQAGLIQQRLDPRWQQPTMLVFAADHGLAAAGVSPYPQAVTAQMVHNFLAGGAAVNVLCREAGVQLRVVNAGVAAEFAAHPLLIDCPVAPGTANSLLQEAMTPAQARLALQRGAQVAQQQHAAGCNVLLLGEMGIGNTSAASLLVARLAGLPLEEVTGRGTGLDDAGVERKRSVLQQVLQRHAQAQEPLQALAAFGGFELAMLAGAALQAAAQRMLIVVDGFIVSAALLLAWRLQPAVLDYCVFAHRSGERGHRLLLQYMQVEPLLDLGLRLGEGSGAALAWPILRSSLALLQDMASFASAGVSTADGAPGGSAAGPA